MSPTNTQPAKVAQTKVIFRKWPEREGGQILALFPEEPHDHDGYYCVCYERIGQHGAADPQGCVSRTRPAKPAEYASLKRELESAPFHYRLKVMRRISRNALAVRRANLQTS